MPLNAVSHQKTASGMGQVPVPGLADPRLAGGEGANLRELIAIISRRRRGILVAAAVAGALGLAYVLATPKAYTATVSILVDGRTRTPLGGEPATNLSAPDTALIESQVRVLASDAILRRVVAREKLGDDLAYGPAAAGLLSRLLGSGILAPDTQEARAARALANLRRNVTVKRSERTYVMDVDVTAADGITAARLANAVSSAYIVDQDDSKAEAARRDTEALNARLLDLQQRLVQAENRVQAYKEKNQIFDANGKRINEQELADGTTALTAARTKTAEAKARLDQIQRIVASGKSVEMVTEALKSPAIDRLRGQYTDIARQEANYRTTLGDRHPALVETMNQAREVRGLINAELKRIAAAAANDYQSARDNETAVGQQVGTLKKNSTATSQAAVELRELEHDVDASKIVYEKFLRARETVGDTGLDGPSARVIAPATAPQFPSAPKSTLVMVLALASGLFMGTGHAFFREYLEQGRSPPVPLDLPVPKAPVERRANWQRWLARLKRKPENAVPVVRPTAPEMAALAVVPDVQVSEAIDSLWAELRLDAPPPDRKGPLTIMVAAAERRCGKTATAVSLAHAAAATGERVLLMDADAVHPGLSRVIDLKQEPELIDLMGTFRPCYGLAEAARSQIQVVPVLEGESQLVRRLLRRTAAKNIEGIAGNFSVVIIDGGTIGEDDNSIEVAEAADRIVLVTRQARLSRLQISRAMSTLEADEDKFGGAVCNGSGHQAAA